MSTTDLETKLLKTKEDGILKNCTFCEMSNWDYFPDEQVVNNSLDQQDWELRLRERGNEELSGDCILPTSNDLLEKNIEEME